MTKNSIHCVESILSTNAICVIYSYYEERAYRFSFLFFSIVTGDFCIQKNELSPHTYRKLLRMSGIRTFEFHFALNIFERRGHLICEKEIPHTGRYFHTKSNNLKNEVPARTPME